MHLAVRSVEHLKSTRSVKALLLKGADRLARDLEGRTPAEHIPDSLHESLR